MPTKGTPTKSSSGKSEKTVYRDSGTGACTSSKGGSFPANRVLKQGEVPKH